MAANNDGIWNSKGAVLSFVLLPHVWQTLWFNTALIGCGLFAAGYSARVITKRRLHRRLKVLEQQHAIEKERSRIAQDMHDEVGAKLTKITFLGSLAKQRLGERQEAEAQIDRISHTARDLIGALDEIVWAVDPKNDSLENFANYLCRYTSEFFDNSPVSCELQIPTEVPNVALMADVRHNLFLAVKESLNNALKHGHAKNVVVELKPSEEAIEISVRDDGVGIKPVEPNSEKPKRVGNGLKNMQQRLISVGGVCQLESTPGKGTLVRFRIPARKR
jgi:signal transduction histidine kinase